jgi:hypothetical protein
MTDASRRSDRFTPGEFRLGHVLIGPILGPAGNVAELVGHVIVNGGWGVVSAVLAVVIYHDLRIAKEGVDTDEIAAVIE